MTRKDYVALADAIAGAFPVPENSTPVTAWALTRDAIADALAADNPRFDRERFIRACAGETASDRAEACNSFGHAWVLVGTAPRGYVARRCQTCDRNDLRRENETWTNGALDTGIGTDER